MSCLAVPRCLVQTEKHLVVLGSESLQAWTMPDFQRLSESPHSQLYQHPRITISPADDMVICWDRTNRAGRYLPEAFDLSFEASNLLHVWGSGSF